MFPVKHLIDRLLGRRPAPEAIETIESRNADRSARFAKVRALVAADARFEAAQELRRERLRVALEQSGANPWEVDLLVKLVDRYRRGENNLIMAMPPQHPQVGP